MSHESTPRLSMIRKRPRGLRSTRKTWMPNGSLGLKNLTSPSKTSTSRRQRLRKLRLKRESKRSSKQRLISSQLRKRIRELLLPVKLSAQPPLSRKLWVKSRQPPAKSLSIVARTSPVLESLKRSTLMLLLSRIKLQSSRLLHPHQAPPHPHPPPHLQLALALQQAVQLAVQQEVLQEVQQAVMQARQLQMPPKPLQPEPFRPERSKVRQSEAIKAP